MSDDSPVQLAEAVEVFFSYSHRDEELRDELAKHLSNLKRQGIITDWYDREISAGTERTVEIAARLNSARIILLLVSADFMASDYIHDVELRRAMERHQAGEAQVIPVILRPVDWDGAPFSRLQPLPKDAIPVTEWVNHDAAFRDIAQGIRNAIKPGSYTPLTTRKRSFLPLFLKASSIAVLVLVLRFLGILQPAELWTFDCLMQLRLPEAQDNRLLIVEVTEEDVNAQKKRNEPMQGSLSDISLNNLLKKLEKYKPRAIGLDVYRDELDFQQNNLFAVCKASDSSVKLQGSGPPSGIPESRVGFSDFVPEEALRRHLLYLEPEASSLCQARDAFSLVLARHYLEIEGKQYYDPSSAGELRIGDVVFKRLQPFTGGYQGIDAAGYQTLLNYRSACNPRNVSSCSPQNIALRVTLSDVLDRNVLDSVENLNQRIVVIGVTHPESGDSWRTPYNAGFDGDMPGVVMQAQMVSQILSAVLDRRPLLWVWPQWGEALWILAWSGVGGALAWWVRPLSRLVGGSVVALLILWASGWVVLSCFGGWIPLVPPALSLAASGFLIRFYAGNQSRFLSPEL
ncbi:CHASE2 domain-containing protein [Leptolyngbya sp. FACHB-261]|uniref:CHASE2 domain-containing protein n=1 Tax=Leptolyngbya sp. FACHB-261 TaxID=2692806 RepID=UPI0016831B2E|nr:CHASE2 domain-containing protein [Leptolyngbya sp. FACHB-261]MBD2101716.1 CHASE2 domain-containing protein [Leptolyngbya sp. FACHB-261]